MRLCLALLIATAAFAQEPEKAPAPPKSPELKFRLIQPPGSAKPRMFVVAPKQTITVRPGNGVVVDGSVCSVRLTNVLPGQPMPPMPTVKPPAQGFSSREVPLPAPPCDERTP